MELDEESEDEGQAGVSEGVAHGKQPGKKTRAQRNKEQRLKDEEQVLSLQLQHPKALCSLQNQTRALAHGRRPRQENSELKAQSNRQQCLRDMEPGKEAMAQRNKEQSFKD